MYTVYVKLVQYLYVSLEHPLSLTTLRMARTKQTFRHPSMKAKSAQASSSYRSPSHSPSPKAFERLASPEVAPPLVVRSQRTFNPIPSPSSIVKSFQEKWIIVEKKCVVEDLVDYNVHALLEAISWGGILTSGGNTYASLVHGF